MTSEHRNDYQRGIIEDLISRLTAQYAGDSSGHDWLHLERVLGLVRKLAEGETVDMFVVEAAALLHDVDDYKFRKPGEGELEKTTAMLAEYDIEEKKKRMILDIVSHVSFKGGQADDRQKSLEGKIVQDADRLDVLGAVGIARVFAYGGWAGHAMYDPDDKPRESTTFEQYKESHPSVNHFYEKILKLKDRLNTPQARKIAEQRHRFVEKFLEQFWGEVSGDI